MTARIVTRICSIDRCESKHYGRDKKAQGERHGSAKVTESQVLQIRKMDGSLKEIAAIFGVSLATISCINRRKTWRHT